MDGTNKGGSGLAGVKALVFDVFGTVVDWRTSVIGDLTAFGQQKGIEADWAAFADAWRAGYAPGMDRVRKGERPWANIDVLHRERLDALLDQFGIENLSEAEKRHLNLAWHRLSGWPDTVPGLTRLKQRYIISTFSNGSVPCLVDTAKHAGLPWDAVFSADIVRHFKPDPETYLGVIAFFGLQPHEVMLVAAHNYDLRHGRAYGMRTAYVNRPTEYGPRQSKDLAAESDWDVVAGSMTELADRLCG
ncbi:haloacid dehalogenase type II [Cupriavidus basilensis]|uniref:(S)-2-haloacid dehalogenase n=1 Tax=Cupriavidus basilensis TaxID=68895 RepID=A0ABT6AWM5_9BURK|nr:haloacid dehalogenase type II [Cupriavidus basilensis]MDF3836637.1 haloacid dehalogenase type II [Cupriavidus basilensis]